MNETSAKPIQSLQIASLPESVNIVERLIEDIRSRHKISEDCFGNMLVAVTEAVTNAIYHGNKSDPKKYIEVKYKVNEDQIQFFIADEGPGFDYYNLPDPTAPENLEKPSGRGIFLMKHLSDQIIFSQNGSLVELYFNI